MYFVTDDNFKTIESGYRTRKSAVDQLSSRLEKVEEEKTNINKQMNESASQLTVSFSTASDSIWLF